MPSFKLDTTLNKDCTILGHFDLCTLLLMNDANYPWCILVPQRADITEIYQLSDEDQQQLTRESSLLASTMNSLFQADKINIAALGNVVKQLHIHHVARYQDDLCWPAPIWGKNPVKPYTSGAEEQIAKQLLDALGNHLTPSQKNG